MDGVYEELDEAKAEIEKLREQYRVKVELAENLMRAQNDLLSKNKETSFKLEKLILKLNEKDDEIFSSKQMCEELKSNLTQKESIIRHITSAHDKLRLDCNEKLHKCEEENKALALALDDANAKNTDQEQQICALKDEIERVKRVVTFPQRKCSESDRASKELEVREDAFVRVEDEKRKFEDQLKWKKEQFVHLQEAHEKLGKQFKKSEKEWEKEKGELLDGISSLQTNLESQTRISQDLQRRLEMCNSALAHAESKRMLLETQLLESRTSLDNVCAEYDEAKLKFENLSTQRDQQIANLRSSLGTKEILYKEMEYQFRKMEQEKQDLMVSLKELQEAQIRESGFSSASKLQNKLKSLEQVHKSCSTNLKAKESEWHLEMEKLSEELNFCRSESKSKDATLEACDSLIHELELLNLNDSLMLLVLELEFSEAVLAAENNSCMNLNNEKVEEIMCELVEQLEKKNAALNSVQKDLDDEREKQVILSRKVQILEEELEFADSLSCMNLKNKQVEEISQELVEQLEKKNAALRKNLEDEQEKQMILSKKLQVLEELQFPLQKELDGLKEMLKESRICRLKLEEQVVLLQSDLKNAHDALEQANDELYEKWCEANEVEFELQIWKCIVEQLDANLKRNHQMRTELEASLLAQIEVELNLKQETESLSHQLEEKEKKIDDLQQQLVEISESTKGEEIPESLHQLVEEKDQRIYDLQQLVGSLEHEFESSTTSFSSKLSQMQKEMKVLRESSEKIKSDKVLKEMEIQEKNIMIVELENDIGNLLQRVDQQEKSPFVSGKKIQETEDELRKKEIEVHKLECENKNLVNAMGLLSEKMEKLSEEDIKLMESLRKIVQTMEISRPQPGSNSDDEHENIVQPLEISRPQPGSNSDDEQEDIVQALDISRPGLNSDDEQQNIVRVVCEISRHQPRWNSDDDEPENTNIFSSLTKKVEAVHEERPPLRAINN